MSDEIERIKSALSANSNGMTFDEIRLALKNKKQPIHYRTLRFVLRKSVESGDLIATGTEEMNKYCLPETISQTQDLVPLSLEGKKIQAYVQKPSAQKNPVGYNRSFLDAYKPNETFYLTPKDRDFLTQKGTVREAKEPAGTYARQILNRLLIDLSWNSSRLEGNTYSLLDTRRLLDFGSVASDKNNLETQMILNHKDAIEFLIDSASEIRFDRFTILNLHALLANNLLSDQSAAGRLRRITVGIEKSVFHPLEGPQIIEDRFHQILAMANLIQDPFEQAFFIMVQLPYLQPFDDVNKRVSRLAANIPLIKANIVPMSFTDVPLPLYTEAILGIYELNQIELLRDLFVWAYERSALRYKVIRQSISEPDPFRLKHRDSLYQLVQSVLKQAMNRQTALLYIHSWASENILSAEQEQFKETTESELMSLHEGNFARYKIRPSEFTAWQEIWNASPRKA